MPTQDCPPLELLKGYRSGLVDAALLDSLAQHIETCRDCETQLESMPPTGSAWWHDSARPPGEPEFVNAVARILDFTLESPVLGAGTKLRDYTLLEVIGEGGMGTVYKARHERLDRIVAVKVIRPKLMGTSSALAWFEREMKAVGRVQDDRIVRALDAGEEDGVAYLAMEFVEGQNLAALVKSQGPLPATKAFDIIGQVARGLAHAHTVGLVHRDIKPGNVMLTNDGRVKILDLGLAVFQEDVPPSVDARDDTLVGHHDDLTQTGRAVGTVHYMAPEQQSNAHTVDARADVYGLGATLWYLLTGLTPKTGPSPPQPPERVWHRLLAENPADRFQSMEDVHAALQPRTRTRYWMPAAAILLFGLLGGMLIPGPTAETPTDNSASPTTLPSAGKLGMTEETARHFQQQWAVHLNRGTISDGPNGHRVALIGPGIVPLGAACVATITRPYAMATTETTFEQFQSFVNATGYRTTAETTEAGGNFLDLAAPSGQKFKHGPQYTWRTPGHGAIESHHPVTQVTQADARAYCEWLTKTSKQNCRLPTEAEWLWAYRAGNAGDPSAPWARKPVDRLNSPYWIRTTVGTPLRPQPVGRTLANPWGLHDMVGNVLEFCEDEYDEIPTEPVRDFCRRGTQHKFAVIHGACYYSVVCDLGNSRAREATCREAVGFRILMELTSPTEK